MFQWFCIQHFPCRVENVLDVFQKRCWEGHTLGGRLWLCDSLENLFQQYFYQNKLFNALFTWKLEQQHLVEWHFGNLLLKAQPFWLLLFFLNLLGDLFFRARLLTLLFLPWLISSFLFVFLFFLCIFFWRSRFRIWMTSLAFLLTGSFSFRLLTCLLHYEWLFFKDLIMLISIKDMSHLCCSLFPMGKANEDFKNQILISGEYNRIDLKEINIDFDKLLESLTLNKVICMALKLKHELQYFQASDLLWQWQIEGGES